MCTLLESLRSEEAILKCPRLTAVVIKFRGDGVVYTYTESMLEQI